MENFENSKFKFYFKGNIENIERLLSLHSKIIKKFDYFIKNPNFDFSIIIKSKSLILLDESVKNKFNLLFKKI